MQVTWNIKNFKILNSGSLYIHPGLVNVISGRNSSGKSSLIQSLLSITQSTGQTGAVILNGPLARLGTVEDVVRDGENSFQLSMKVQDEKDTHYVDLDIGPGDGIQRELSGDPVVREVSIRNANSADGSNILLLAPSKSRQYASADHDLIRGRSEFKDSAILQLATTLDESNPLLPRVYVEVVGIQARALHLCGTEHAYRKMFKRYFKEVLGKGAGLSHRDPTSFIYNSIFLRHSADRSEATRDGFERYMQLSLRSGEKRSREFRNLVDKLADELTAQQFEDRVVDGHVSVNLPAEGRDLLELGMRNDLNPVAHLVGEKLPETVSALTALNGVGRFLSTRLTYLGPLRDEPRIVWSHTSQQNPNLPVGARGEYSAWRLERFGHRVIEFWNGDGNKVTDSLIFAVSYWLKAMGVAKKVEVRSEANLGLRLEVEVEKSKRDLTAVGVGVSQVLPVVTGLLSTPPGGVFVAEQPELHLHPAVQASLMDFFLQARPDVCVIVETHSEALITRARRRIAEGTSSTQSVALQFIDQVETGGSQSRLISLEEDGDLDFWPEGFMDDGADLRRIMQLQALRIRGSNGS